MTSQVDHLFNASLDLLAVASLRTRAWLRINPTFERVLGWRCSDLVRRSGLHLVHPRDRRATLEAVKTLSAGHALKNFENCLLCRDGSERVFQWNAVPQRDRGEIYCVARDVTDERTDQRLRRDEERAQAVLTELCVRLDPAAGPAKLMDRASRLLKTALQAEEVSFSLIANGPDPDRAEHDDGTSGDPDAPPVRAGSASRGGSEAEAEPSSLAQAPTARLTHIYYEDGEVIGCLRATLKPSRRWSAGDERLFSSAAGYIGDALQTARKEQELREARDRLATLVEGAAPCVAGGPQRLLDMVRAAMDCLHRTGLE